jgi:hypothetical protein
MAIDSVFDGARSDDGSRARPRIERGLRAAGREIRAGRYGSADKIVRGLSGIRADEVRQHLSGEEIVAMQKWERGETGRDPHVVGRRATLTSAERHKIPSSKFALPKERKYPIQDLAHAKSARSYATTEYQDGKLTKAQWEMVYRKTAERYPDLDPKTLVCEKKGRKKRCHSVPKGGRARGRRADLGVGGHWESEEDYVNFLQSTLIPDYEESAGGEPGGYAQDFRRIVELLEEKRRDRGFEHWLRNTLIPDTIESGREFTAEDLEAGLYWMKKNR